METSTKVGGSVFGFVCLIKYKHLLIVLFCSPLSSRFYCA